MIDNRSTSTQYAEYYNRKRKEREIKENKQITELNKCIREKIEPVLKNFLDKNKGKYYIKLFHSHIHDKIGTYGIQLKIYPIKNIEKNKSPYIVYFEPYVKVGNDHHEVEYVFNIIEFSAFDKINHYKPCDVKETDVESFLAYFIDKVKERHTSSDA